MRWDRFFDDLEDQLASEWEAERAALESEAERLRLSRVPLRDRLTILGEGPSRPAASFEMRDGSTVVGYVGGVGADWAALEPAEVRAGAVLVPLASIMSIAMPQPDLLRTARPVTVRSSLSERMTLGFALRDLVRRRVSVSLHLVSARSLTGTIDRAGSDHLDLALHEPGTPRRTGEVRGHRIIPFEAIAWIRLEGGEQPR